MRKLRIIREQATYASESAEIQKMLLDARPLAGKTWNLYIAAITADPRKEGEYVKNLVALADEIIRELDPLKCSPAVLIELKKMARERVSWPSFVSKHEMLELNANDGRKKKHAQSGVASEVAASLLTQIREEIARFSASWITKRPSWDFF